MRAIRTLTAAGIPVSVSVAPIIPFVTEPEIERILEAALEAGAIGAHYVVLRLPHEVNPLFQEWLQAHFPERAQRVMNRVRDLRGGKDYDSDFTGFPLLLVYEGGSKNTKVCWTSLTYGTSLVDAHRPICHRSFLYLIIHFTYKIQTTDRVHTKLYTLQFSHTQP